MTAPNYYNRWKTDFGLHIENVVLTPHTAGAASESVRRTLEVSVENILRAASGEKPQNLVSP